MNWQSLFKKTPNLNVNQVRDIIENDPPDSYQLLDVRQPAEYKKDHIPGAILIPLQELPTRYTQLETTKRTIVYCRSGVRSKAGVQILDDNGFTEAINMMGGILQWRGHRAFGDETLGLELFLDGDFSSACSMAMAMENGLKSFYQTLADKTQNETSRDLLIFMARLEDSHMEKLQKVYCDDASFIPSQSTANEGGIDSHAFLEQYDENTVSITDIIRIGMMFESQAYDLYLRLARKEQDPKRKDFFMKMAAEEHSHLETLTRELEKRIQ